MSSEWYLWEAIRLLREIKRYGPAYRRKQVLHAMRHLISYLAGRLPPERPNAVNRPDEARCDHCFQRIQEDAESLTREVCDACERSRRKKPSKTLTENDPTLGDRIESHKKRVGKELRRLGLGA